MAELRPLRLHLPGIKLVQIIHVCDASALAQAKRVAPLIDALLLDSGNPNLSVKELPSNWRRLWRQSPDTELARPAHEFATALKASLPWF